MSKKIRFSGSIKVIGNGQVLDRIGFTVNGDSDYSNDQQPAMGVATLLVDAGASGASSHKFALLQNPGLVAAAFGTAITTATFATNSFKVRNFCFIGLNDSTNITIRNSAALAGGNSVNMFSGGV